MVGPGLTAQGFMSDWIIPRGTHFFNSPIVMSGQSGVTWRGYGGSQISRLVYIGPSTKTFLQIAGSSRCLLKDFEICIASPGVEYAVLQTNLPGGGHLSTNNVVDNVRVVHGGKPTAADYCFGIDSTAIGGIDANNDHHKFTRCFAGSYQKAGYKINGTQVHQIVYEQCLSHDHGGRGGIGWDAMRGVYFTLRDCGGNSNDIDIHIGAAMVNILVQNWNSENAKQFIVGETAGETFEKIDTVRWEGKPVAGLPVIDCIGPGPRTLSNALISGINGICPQIRIRDNNLLSLGSLDFSGVMIRQHLGTVPATPLVSIPAHHSSRFYNVKHQRINENDSRTNTPVAVNTPQTA